MKEKMLHVILAFDSRIVIYLNFPFNPDDGKYKLYKTSNNQIQ